MSFIPVAGTRLVPGVGPTNAKIAIVAEAPGAHEEQQLKPMVGPAGGVLEQCMHAAGLIRSEVYITNVVKERPPRNDIAPFFNETKGTFTDRGQHYVHQLHRELSDLNPNLIVACGGTAFAALTGRKGVMKYRGYFFESQGLDRTFKCMGTIHPSFALRGNYIYRHIIAADLRKAKDHSNVPELIRPERQFVYNFTTPREVIEWLDYYVEAELVSVDIEVLNYEVSCIGFSGDPKIAISIPIDQRWSVEDEIEIWKAIQRVLGNKKSIKVFQNGIFDIHFLLTRCGVVTRGEIHDTMVAHHIVYPELPKGLSFLVSIYGGTQAYYKDMVKFSNIKGES